ncbi:potassium channel subfamily K member 5-like [Thalassophryne amazonica]|uniref:potassium channel subfamily K member 5-like n=1 Tax=Thalassophryne amazonica TaxID=390379 RepID=UPI00147102C9|nr:potassium channel subfamily K member 5-like [Thalassophryne amazonica]
MADKGPFLTSCIIFYLSIGAAIFQILEEPNWKSAKAKYLQDKQNILKKYTCLTQEDLDGILQVVSEAAGQGVTITGDKYRNTWDWLNSMVFAATIVTTIGYGNVAPKTVGGRVFCILYGLCGIPLCLVWISDLGSFFGDRAKRLSQIMIRKGVSVKKVQFTCTVLFLLWGLFMHLVIPPFVFMSVERWSYLEGLYFSFITLTTVGFGDYVAGVNPDIDYPALYRVFAELWIYMGLAWLSLFFTWNIHMVVKAHKVLKKKRRQRHKFLYDDTQRSVEQKPIPETKPTVIDIFNFLSEKDEDYSTVINEIGKSAKKSTDCMNRSKSCSDILGTHIQTLDSSPRHRRISSISEVFMNKIPGVDTSKKEEEEHSPVQGNGDPEQSKSVRTDFEKNTDECEHASNMKGITISVPPKDTEEIVHHPDNRRTRFRISKVVENDEEMDKDENM